MYSYTKSLTFKEGVYKALRYFVPEIFSHLIALVALHIFRYEAEGLRVGPVYVSVEDYLGVGSAVVLCHVVREASEFEAACITTE